MRACVSGSPNVVVGELVDRIHAVHERAAELALLMPCGFPRYKTGEPSERNATPEYSLDKNPLLHNFGEIGC